MWMKWMLFLYPPRWRERYQEEMLALLEQHSVTYRTVLSLLRGALDARLDPYFITRPIVAPMTAALRLRRAHSAIFWTFPAMILGYMFFLDGLDDAFYPWTQAHTTLRELKAGSEFALAMGLVCLVLTGLSLTFILIKDALASGNHNIRGVRLWMYGSILLILFCCACISLAPAFCVRLLPLLLIVGPLPLAVLLPRHEVPRKFLRFALVPLIFTILAMLLHLVYTTIWAGAIWHVAALTVQQMARAVDRSVWPGDWWRMQIVGGCLWMGAVTGHMFRRLRQGLSTLKPENETSTVAE